MLLAASPEPRFGANVMFHIYKFKQTILHNKAYLDSCRRPLPETLFRALASLSLFLIYLLLRIY